MNGIKLAQHSFAVAGVLALGYCMAVFLYGRLYEARESRKFDMELVLKQAAKGSAFGPIAAAAAPENGGIIGWLDIQRIGVSVMVVEGVDGGDLKYAAGHIPGTALPGEPGNVGIAAHRDTFFRPLRSIRRDDAITLSTLHGTYPYRVVSTDVVRPQDVEVLHPGPRDSLTLVTCFPFQYIGPAPKRFIVRAERTPVQ